MIERHDYPVTVDWIEASRGIATSSEQLPKLVVTSPPEFGGPPHQWSPEHLFVASVASCFMTTYLAIARASKLDVEGLEVPAIGSLVRDDHGRYSMEHIALRPQIKIQDEADRSKASRLVEKADELCLISRSVRSGVTVEAEIQVASSRMLGARNVNNAGSAAWP